MNELTDRLLAEARRLKQLSREVYPLLHDVDIYELVASDERFDACPIDQRGWNDHTDAFRELTKDAKIIVEIGSWKGNSAITLAKVAPQAEIVCIDTWTGSAEMWDDHADETRYGSLRLEHGYPTLYRQFIANVIRAGVQDRITPFPVPSSVGMEFLKRKEIKPDLIYIDGSHDFNSVCMDIGLTCMSGAAIICGDDYHSWDGVRSAVDYLLPDAKHDEKGFWWWKRP